MPSKPGFSQIAVPVADLEALRRLCRALGCTQPAALSTAIHELLSRPERLAALSVARAEAALRQGSSQQE